MELEFIKSWKPPTLPVEDFFSYLKENQKPPGRCATPRWTEEKRNCITLFWDRPVDCGSCSTIVYRVEQLSQEAVWKEVGVCPLPRLELYGLEGETSLRVVAGNVHGWGPPSQHVLLSIPFLSCLPVFLQELPGEVTLNKGDSITLTCKVKGCPKPWLQWYKKGEQLSWTGDSLSLEALEEGGLYTVEAANPVGRLSSHCYITVLHPGDIPPERHQIRLEPPEGEHGPEIRLPLKDRTADPGQTVRFTCEVVGNPAPTVEWQRDSHAVDNDCRTFSEGSFYTLEVEASEATCGLYSARAVGLGVAVTAARLSLAPHQPPLLFSLPLEAATTVHQGGHVRLIASLAPHCRLAKVQWYRGATLLAASRDCVMTHSASGELSLELAHVSPRSAGTYTCLATSPGGQEAVSKCRLDVTSPSSASSPIYTSIPYSSKPLFVTRPRNMEVLEGDTVIFKCEVVGDPNPTVTWLRDNLKLSYYSRDQGEFRSSGSGAECCLEVRQCKFTYTGAYTVVATNCHGQTRALFSLQVFSRGQGKEVKCGEGGVVEAERDSLPLVSRPLKDTVVADKSPLVLQCRIKGHPEPTVLWTKDNKPVKGCSTSFEAETACLEIRSATSVSGGVYTCTASNRLGTATTSALVRVNESMDEESVTISTPDTVSPCVTRGGPDLSQVEEEKPRHRRPSSPRLLSVPHSQVVTLGETVRLLCSVSGWPDPAAVWTHGSRPVSPRSRSGEEGEERWLVIPGIRHEDAGLYTVQCTNTRGTVRASATIQVIGGRGGREGVKWRAPSGRDDYQERRSEGEEEKRSEDSCWEASVGAGLPNSRSHQDTTTQGMCEDRLGGDLVLKGLEDTITAVEGRPILLTVTITGGEVRWEKGGKVLPSCEDFFQERKVDECCLRIRDPFLEDSGLYTCRVTGVDGRVQYTSTHLVIVEEGTEEEGCDGVSARERGARLVRPPQDLTALRGSRAILQAVYVGLPQPTVTWLKGGRRLSSSGRISITSKEGVATLAVDPVLADDSGKYVITVTNRLATDTHFASLSVEGAPDPPAGRPSVSPCGQAAVTVAWSSPHYDGGSMVVGYSLERSEDTLSWTTVAHSCDRLSERVGGLHPGSSYSFRVRSHNSHGASEPGPPSHPYTVPQHEPVEEPRKWENVEIEPGECLEERYNILEEVGKGRYGVVRRSVELSTGLVRAAKYVRTVKRQDRDSVQQEVDIMNSLRHPLLLGLIAAFSLSKDVVMILEYVSGGELFERVVADDFTLTEKDCILFMRQICEAVAYMHTKSIVHLDLKPENIMCRSRRCHVIKLIDFGLARRLEPDTQLRVLFGTPEFIPPEIINYEPIGFQSDMWSVGVIAYVLLSGLSPFMGETDPETFANITRAQYDFDDEAFDTISEDAKDFISALLRKRKEKRLSAEECLRHKWISQGDDTMSQVKISTDKLKKFIIRRKWQKTGNAIRALGRMASLSRRGGGGLPSSSRTAEVEEPHRAARGRDRARAFSERSDSGFSDLGPAPSWGLDSAIEEEPHHHPFKGPVSEDGRSTDKRLNEPPVPVATVEPPEATKKKDAKVPGSANIQKAFAFWNR